jgi:hypothetical protein
MPSLIPKRLLSLAMADVPPAAGAFTVPPAFLRLISARGLASSRSRWRKRRVRRRSSSAVLTSFLSSIAARFVGLTSPTVVLVCVDDSPQVGGQSTDYSTIDTEIKTSGLKNDSLAPPDFLTHSVQGITWRLGFGIWNTQVCGLITPDASVHSQSCICRSLRSGSPTRRTTTFTSPQRCAYIAAIRMEICS